MCLWAHTVRTQCRFHTTQQQSQTSYLHHSDCCLDCLESLLYFVDSRLNFWPVLLDCCWKKVVFVTAMIHQKAVPAQCGSTCVTPHVERFPFVLRARFRSGWFCGARSKSEFVHRHNIVTTCGSPTPVHFVANRAQESCALTAVVQCLCLVAACPPVPVTSACHAAIARYFA